MPTHLESPSQSRSGKRPVAGYFTPEVLRELKKLGAEKDLTLQCLLAIAINDLFERHGMKRIANETPLPRGGAAQKLYRKAAGQEKPAGQR